MENIQSVIMEIEKNKWVKNKLKGNSNIYSKVLLMDSELYLLIKSDTNKYPVLARIEAIQTQLNDFCIYYDGEGSISVDGDEYKKLQKYIDKIEWEIINESDYEEKLQKGDLINHKGYYIDIHENYNAYEAGNGEEVLKEIKKILNIK